MKKLILASTSPRRKDLLKQAGFKFESVASSFEEDMTLPLPPGELVRVLSLGKASAVADLVSGAVVIGADTVVEIGGTILGKPHTKEKALAMLRQLSGKEHSVHTGLTVIDSDNRQTASLSVETKIVFKELSDGEIEGYVSTGEPLDKAGAYGIQSGGAALVERVEGSHSNVVGLPMEVATEVLKEFGITSNNLD